MKWNIVPRIISCITHNREDALSEIAPPSRENLPFLKEYKNELLLYFDFWPAIVKCYCVYISRSFQNNS